MSQYNTFTFYLIYIQQNSFKKNVVNKFPKKKDIYVYHLLQALKKVQEMPRAFANDLNIVNDCEKKIGEENAKTLVDELRLPQKIMFFKGTLLEHRYHLFFRSNLCIRK